ncbi:MAG: hypothetical protein ACYSO4_05240 [Planctomycetota bacterium]|jgi:hypothetical protein
MMSRKRRQSDPESTLYRAFNTRSPEDLNKSKPFNTTLVFAKQSQLHDTYAQLQQAFIDLLSSTPIPDGLCAPIATGPKRAEISRRTVETLLANIFNMNGRKALSVGLDHGQYSHTKLSGSGFVNLVKLASHRSHMLLGMKKGFQDLANPKNSRNARIWPTKKFHALMENSIVSEDDIVSVPHDLINLKQTTGKGKNKKKNIIPRKTWIKELTPEQFEWLHIIEGSLRWFNLVFGEYEMQYTSEHKTEHYLFPCLYAIYTNDFEHGGRFYTGKGGHQNLTKKERASITFNGHSTAELDFGGLHLRMLYHLQGDNFPLKGCPYGLVLETMGKNATRLFKRCPELKNDLKKIVFGMVNGTVKNPKNLFAEAVNRSKYRLFNDVDESWEERKERKQRWTCLGLLDSNGSPTQVVKAFNKAHKPIEKKFYSGCGLTLQNLDAQIAYWIMAEIMFSQADCCIPTLPVHDSFITFSEYKDHLKDAMKMVYSAVLQQQTNTQKYYKIPIK